MSASTRQTILSAVQAMPAANPQGRVHTAIALVLRSPDFIVQKQGATMARSQPANSRRRRFLQRAARLSAAAGSPLALNLLAIGAACAHSASARSATDHQALVCIYLSGGNNQSNTVVPTSGAGCASYLQARLSLALPAAQLLGWSPLGYSGQPLGLHPAMGGLKALFDRQRLAVLAVLAVLANVGSLAVPITQAQWNNGSPTVAVPAQLTSHSDQQGAWQTGLPDRPSETGWLGRIGDLLASAYNPGSGVTVAMSMAGNNFMQAGDSTIQYPLTTPGAVKVQALGDLFGSAAGAVALRRLMTDTRTGLLEGAITAVGARAVSAQAQVSNALSSGAVAGAGAWAVFPDTGIGRQLQRVARMIAACDALAQAADLLRDARRLRLSRQPAERPGQQTRRIERRHGRLLPGHGGPGRGRQCHHLLRV